MTARDVRHLTRRSLLKAGAAASALAAGASFSLRAARAQETVALTAGPAEVPLVGEGYPSTRVWAFNGSVPGPVIRARQGERLQIEVANALDEPTTVHWHGLRVPVAMDGVPYLSQAPIEPGGSFVYAFDLADAGTYWYHPHINSAEQVGRGLYGALIVEESSPPVVDRELLWVLDDWRLDQEAQITPFGNMHDMSHAGRIGNSVTINGAIPKTERVRAGERLRLRLINAANARTFGLDFGMLNPWVIALDGQPVEPYRLDDAPLLLAAATRADLIVDMTGAPGSESEVVDGAYGPDYAYELIRFSYGDQAPLDAGEREPPAALVPNPIKEPDPAQAERHRLVFEGGAMGGMAGAMMGGRRLDMRELAGRGRLWAINGVVPEDLYRDAPLFESKLGGTVLLALENRTAFAHPIHLHGHSFRVLTRNGQTEPHQPMRDTVTVGADETVEIAFVADNPGRWMVHCHVLEHQMTGMMGVLAVA
ncbi:MAG: multicopper oxidase family protein [Alphaproteobacteria bacterium]